MRQNFFYLFKNSLLKSSQSLKKQSGPVRRKKSLNALFVSTFTMAAHVIVIDSTARSARIKTVPGKHLTDILEEACTKLGRDPSCHGLKYVDMLVTQ